MVNINQYNSILECINKDKGAINVVFNDNRQIDDIDGVYGLQRGFKMAGVKTIVMSLWKVSDEATRILMEEFYRNLVAGKKKYQALIDAQRFLRNVENGKYDKPHYWASFIMLDGLN